MFPHILLRVTRARVPTCHDAHVTVAVGHDVVQRRLPRQMSNDRRPAEGAHFLLFLRVEAVHLIGQAHHLRWKAMQNVAKK